VDNFATQLEAAAAGAEVVEPELEPLDEELDFSDDEELVDSELLPEPLEELDALAELLAESRLSVR
jgi:hypothetical protein